ncbi:hypothetical protein TNCV_1116211 [Trichonephila clavipes]|nr:hypothetical protein TNCV_1116211 [Trichonephila clavipes]
MEPSSNSPSVEHRNVEFSDSFRYFILKIPATFTNVSPFLIEKAITGSIGEVKSIRKMRSGDLFLEVSSSNQATALIKLQKLAHLDITKAPHSNLNFSRGVISPADFLNVSTEEIKENMKAQKVCDVRRITIRRDGQSDHTSPIRCDAFSASARDLDIRKQSAAASPPALDVKRRCHGHSRLAKRRKSDGRSVAQTFVFWLLARSKCEDLITSFISWNCRGLRTRPADLKSIISTYQPACVALQETFLKSTMTMQVRGYNCVRRDVDGDTSPSGGVCLFTSNLFPSNVVTRHTSLQAVAVRIHIHSLVTVCCVYLPPNDVVSPVDLNLLVSQLPAPFILLGDFIGHSPLWGHDVTNSRGRQIEQLISAHCLCLLNNDEKTYFHAATRTFHSLDLAICSPTLLPMLNFEVANDLHNSDHFPLLVSHVNGAGTRFRPPTYHFHRADWDKFTRLAIITGTMVQNRAVVEAVFNVTEAIRNAADAAIPRTSNSPRKLCKPWWNASCQQAKKEQRRAWGIFRRYPTTDNLIAFKRAKALARRIRRQCQRESWIQYVFSITSSTTSQQLWRKVKAANGLYREFNIPILETSTALFSSPLDVASLIGKTFASVSSSDSYSPAF